MISDRLPEAIDGVPLRIRTVDVTVNRARFIFNPTNCNQRAVNGTLVSVTGAAVSVASRFQATRCAGLPFSPELTASTEGQTSKARGAALRVKVAAGKGDANIAKIDFELPLQLPSRLSTLQKACLAAQFASNPAGCPEGAIVGAALVRTPVLNAPLTGPIYLVSYGDEKFPEVEIVLQGEGVEVVLDGTTDIKKGVTDAHFDTLPDAPINVAETTLPEGPHSLLGTFIAERLGGNLRSLRLTMPTTITAQNGAVITQNTRIEQGHCPQTLAVRSAVRRRKALRLTIYVPSSGRLEIAGSGVCMRTIRSTGPETVTGPRKFSGQGRFPESGSALPEGRGAGPRRRLKVPRQRHRECESGRHKRSCSRQACRLDPAHARGRTASRSSEN